MATSWGMKFPDIPPCIQLLNSLEQRMVSPIIPFMQLRPLKQYALNPQLGMKGSVVNILIDLDEMLQVLPRSFDQMATVEVKLKRHMDHKSDYKFEIIRPAIVCEALMYLVTTPLYLQHKISVSTLFVQKYFGHFTEEIDFNSSNGCWHSSG